MTFLRIFWGVLSIIAIVLFAACGNTSEENTEKHFEDSKAQMEQEFSQEMKENGNHEISVDELEKDLNSKDEELEEMMQDMENEMEGNNENDEPERLDSLE